MVVKGATVESTRVELNDGATMPVFGFGTWDVADAAAGRAVVAAIAAGYRLIDTAWRYGNEAGVGAGLRASGLRRDALFLTTKLWVTDQGFDSTLRAFDRSLEAMGLETLDLYAIHWPAPRRDLYVESWRAMVRLRAEGRVRSIGVCNFLEHQLERIIGETGVTPEVNQIECHPRYQRRALRGFCEERDIFVQSWSPLGRGALLNDPVIATIAARHGASVAQIILCWHRDRGLGPVPKSSGSHMRENIEIGEIVLDDDDLAAIDALDSPDGRIGPTCDDDNVN